MPQPVVGFDLSRAFIDLCVLPSGKTQKIPNTPDAIPAWAAELESDAHVVFETTSGCDGHLIAALAERGQPFCRVNSRQVREFARHRRPRQDRQGRCPRPGRYGPHPQPAGYHPHQRRTRPACRLPGSPRTAGGNAQGREPAPPQRQADRRGSHPLGPGCSTGCGAGHRTDGPGHPARRAARTGNALPLPHRLPRRPHAPCQGKGYMARGATHPGRTAKGARRALHRSAISLTASPKPHRHAL
jgi:hypothetical protein